MASAADLNLVSVSSSSSERVSSRAMASAAPRCSMRICRCLATEAPESRAARRSHMLTAMELGKLAREVNRGMIAFDLALGSGALLAPAATLRVLGHRRPSPDAEYLFRRCGPIWLTFAAAHAVAAVRDRPQDWWALAWLRATEIATDAVWARSPGVDRPGASAGLRPARPAHPGLHRSVLPPAPPRRPDPP